MHTPDLGIQAELRPAGADLGGIQLGEVDARAVHRFHAGVEVGGAWCPRDREVKSSCRDEELQSGRRLDVTPGVVGGRDELRVVLLRVRFPDHARVVLGRASVVAEGELLESDTRAPVRSDSRNRADDPIPPHPMTTTS